MALAPPHLTDWAHCSPMAAALVEAVREISTGLGKWDVFFGWDPQRHCWLEMSEVEQDAMPVGSTAASCNLYATNWYRIEGNGRTAEHRTDGGPARADFRPGFRTGGVGRPLESAEWWVDDQRIDNDPAVLRLKKQWEQAERDYDRARAATAPTASRPRRLRV